MFCLSSWRRRAWWGQVGVAEAGQVGSGGPGPEAAAEGGAAGRGVCILRLPPPTSGLARRPGRRPRRAWRGLPHLLSPPPPPTLPLPLLRPVFMAVHRSLGGRFWTSLYTLLCCSCGLRWEPFNEHSGACCNVVAVARTEPLARNEVAGTPSLTSPSPSASLSLSFSLYS